MSEHPPPLPRETPDELVAGKRPARFEARPDRAERTSRAGTAMTFALVAGLCAALAGTSTAYAESMAESMAESAAESAAETASDESPADPAVVRQLETDMAALFDQLGADLDARLEAKTDAIVQQAAKQQVADMRFETARNLVMAQEVAKRKSEQLAHLGDGAAEDRRARVDARDPDKPVKIASGSLALHQQTSPNGADEHVERGRHRFEESFVSPPKVALGMRLLDRPQRPRVAIRVVNVDRKGFDYEVRTWGDPSVTALTADWVAYARGGSTAPPAAPR